MKKSINLVMVMALLSLFFVSCQKDFIAIKGEGKVVTQQIDVTEFDVAELTGAFDVEISYGDNYEMVAEGQQNIIDRLKLDNDGENLCIKLERGNYRDYILKIYLTVPDIEGVKLSGSGDIVMNKFTNLDNLTLTIRGSGNITSTDYITTQTTNFEISGSGDVDFLSESEKIYTEISGSGDVKLVGTTNSNDITISGSGEFNCFDLATEQTTINCSGSGDCEVTASAILSISISGSGNIYYKGSPEIDTNISGSGNIISAN